MVLVMPPIPPIYLAAAFLASLALVLLMFCLLLWLAGGF